MYAIGYELPRAPHEADADWSALERIAASRGDLYGGTPSRNAAIVRLIREELRRLERVEARSDRR